MTVRPLRAELLEQCDEVQPLDRVGTVQRFVEHEHMGIAHERRGNLRALAHALAEGVDVAVGDVEHLDGSQRVLRRAPVADSVDIGDVVDELARGEPGGHGFVLRNQREPPEHLAVATRVAGLRLEPSPGSRR
jgi:hypothetical protein